MPKQRHPGSKKMSPAMTFMNLTAGKWVSQAIAVSAELGIADLLKRRTKTAAQIRGRQMRRKMVCIDCSVLWLALGSSRRPKIGHFALLRSASYFAPTRRKH